MEIHIYYVPKPRTSLLGVLRTDIQRPITPFPIENLQDAFNFLPGELEDKHGLLAVPSDDDDDDEPPVTVAAGGRSLGVSFKRKRTGAPPPDMAADPPPPPPRGRGVCWSEKTKYAAFCLYGKEQPWSLLVGSLFFSRRLAVFSSLF